MLAHSCARRIIARLLPARRARCGMRGVQQLPGPWLWPLLWRLLPNDAGDGVPDIIYGCDARPGCKSGSLCAWAELWVQTLLPERGF